MTEHVPLRSAASKETLSSSRSMTVCTRSTPQCSRSDVLGVLVLLEGHLGETLHPGVFEPQFDAFRGQQRGVLAAERGIRFGQYTYEILHHQRFELDANRQTALQLRDQIRRLRHVKGAGC